MRTITNGCVVVAFVVVFVVGEIYVYMRRCVGVSGFKLWGVHEIIRTRTL